MRRLLISAFVCTVAFACHPASAQTNGTAMPVPTPGPSGTPETIGVPAIVGSPLPSAPARPEDVPVPITNPAPKHEPKSFVRSHETFVVGDYLLQPKVYNEFSEGFQTTNTSYQIRGAAEFNIGILPVMLEGESRNQAYSHDSSTPNAVACDEAPFARNVGCVRRIGSDNGSGYVTPFIARDYDVDGRVGIKLLEPRIYLNAAYLWKSNNAGYGIASGYGFGLEKLPDFEGPLGVYFGLYYFPNVTGQYRGLNNATSEGYKYRIYRYEGGAVITPPHSPIFFDLGVEGDRENGFAGAPGNETHFEPYAGIGIRPQSK